RGGTKCVPLKVERKLYSATLLVKFVTEKVALVLKRSAWKRLSQPLDMSNRLRAAMRGGLRSSSSVPGAGILSSGEERPPGVQLVSGWLKVARTPSQDN